MPPTTDAAGGGGAAVGDVGELLARAEQGDESVLDRLRAFLDERPEVWRQVGDMARHAEAALLDLAAGKSLLARESVRRRLDELRRELAPASPLERLLAERVGLCWLRLHVAELDAAAQAGNGGVGPRSAHAQRRLGQAHREFLQAVKQLAVVARLLRPALSPLDLARRPVDERGVPRRAASRAGNAHRDGAAVAN